MFGSWIWFSCTCFGATSNSKGMGLIRFWIAWNWPAHFSSECRLCAICAHTQSMPSYKCFPGLAFETVSVLAWLTVAISCPFLSTSSLYTSLLQAIDGVISMALCLQVVSQAPQHFRSFKTQTLFWWLLSPHLSTCLGQSLQSNMSRTEHPQESLTCSFCTIGS